MAVRRLAPDDVQPSQFAFSAETESWAKAQIAKYPEGRQASAVIPLLWRVQKDCDGWLPRVAIEAVAERLAMPYIRVLEVATFYTMFNLEPVGKYYIQMCGTTPCQLRGSDGIKAVLKKRIGEAGHVTQDGLFSWLEVECLGACCNAPMVQINDDYFEDLTPETFEALLDDLAAGRPVKIGSQAGRTTSEPQGGPFTLTDETLFDGSRVGAWKKRFAEEADAKAAKDAEEKAKAEAEAATKEAAVEPKPAKPDAGRATETPVADAPAQRAAAGEEPIPADKQKAAASTKTRRVRKTEDSSGKKPGGPKKS